MAFNFGTSVLPTSDNTFSLGSASKRWKINDQEITFDTIYPIGAIYISVSNIDPGTLFGGTWEAIGGQFLIGANSSYTAGNTGGSATMSHTHTMAHTHTMSHTHSQVATTSGGPSTNTSGGNNGATAGPSTNTSGGNNNATAGPSNNTSGGPSNNTSGSTAITEAQMPSHGHISYMYDAAYSENYYFPQWVMFLKSYSNHIGQTTNTSQVGRITSNGFTSNTGSNYGHTHTLSSHTHTLSSHTHTMSSHTHTLSSHTHTMSSHTHTLSSHTHSTSATTTGGASNATTSAASNTTTSEASNTNNMPPYLVVYMWKRVA